MHNLKNLSSRQSRGFTFTELLIAMGIALMVLTLAGGSLYYSARSAKDAFRTTNSDFELMKIYAQMRYQIVNMYEPTSEWPSYIKVTGTAEKMDMIRFLTTYSLFGNGTVEAAYCIKQDEQERKWLAYREFPYPRDMTLPENAIDAQDNLWTEHSAMITGLEILHIDGENEIKDWTGNEFPQKIKIIFTYQVPVPEETFEFTVVPGLTMFRNEGL